jgi:Heterokaryon incompatibility protein (HET)
MFPAIGHNMTKLYPEYPDTNIPSAQAKVAGLSSFSTKSAFAALKGWLDDCSRNHITCGLGRRNLERYVPKRVLDVGRYGSDPIILRETRGESSPYIALSHCWGEQKEFPIPKCTMSTFTKFKNGIDYNELPKSFQDAVAMTQHLGIRYLWIDSICIIQDSPSDWAVHCEEMSSIYRSAFLVISATASWNSKGGCFHETLRNIEWNFKTSTGEPAILNIRQSHDHSAFGEPINARAIPRTGETYKSEYPAVPAPVFGRAWCYQERLLGSRIIHYADTELIFECLTAVNCECGALFNWKNEDLLLPRQLLAGITNDPGSMSHISPSGEWLPTQWREIVTAYSSKDLTVHTDKIPAIAGLAKRFQRLGMGSYHAGIFQVDLFRSLLWTSSSPEKDRRPNTYIAPSWSWASVKGKIFFQGSQHWLYDHNRNEYSASIVEIKSILENPQNTFGRIKSGFLKLEGYMTSGKLVSDANNEYSIHFSINVRDSTFNNSAFNHCGYMADCHKESAELVRNKTEVACFWFYSNRTNPQTRFMSSLVGFVLLSDGESGVWKRIGLCQALRVDVGCFPTVTNPKPKGIEWKAVKII